MTGRWLWASLAAVVMLANTDTFGAATFPVIVALAFAWLGARADHDSGAQVHAISRRKVRR